MEEKIFSMYAKGMTTETLNPTCVNYTILIFLTAQSADRSLDKNPADCKEWQERPLEEVYAVVFMDGSLSCPQRRTYRKKRAVYIALSIDMSGKRCPWNVCWRERKCEVLAFYHEWIKNRGVEDILIA